VFCLARHQGRIIAGGSFEMAGGVPSRNLAAWDGSNWLAMSSEEPNDTVRGLQVFGDELWIGGWFDGIGDAECGHLARYACACRPDFDGDGFLTGVDYDAYVLAFEAGEISSDFDQDGFVTGLDFDAYVLAFEAGC
jgi:hypothetical protein